MTKWRNGLLNELLLTVPMEGTWEEALARLEAKLDESRSMLAGRSGQLTVDVGSRCVSPPDLEALVGWLREKHGLLVVAVVTTDAVTQDAARKMTLNTYLMPPGGSVGTSTEAFTGNNALYLPGTVRSGQRVVHPGPIVVAGDINAGAEVIAEGDILVFGTLRGLAHAGSQGNTEAKIMAGNMRPQQIRIADKIARAPEDTGRGAGGSRNPEVAQIENGEISVSPV